MKILLTGGSGLLGRAVRAELTAGGHTVSAPTHAEYNLCDGDAVARLLETGRPEAIVNCAAQRRPDLCESDSPEVHSLNIDLPARLAAAGVPLVHISTDYVFDGTDAPYETDAPRCPLNGYGRQKAAAEEAIEALPNVVILRVPILFGPTPDLRASAVTVLAANLMAARGASVPMDDVAVRYPTFTPDVARQIAAMLPGVGITLQGIYHYTGTEAMTKHLMALTIAPLVGCQAEQCLPDRHPTAVPRPYDCHLSVRRLQEAGLWVPPTPFVSALLRVL